MPSKSPVPAELALDPTVTWSGWRSLRELRAGLARRAGRRPPAAVRLLDGWGFSDRPEVVEALVAGLTLPESEDTRRLALWAFGDGHEDPGGRMTEAEHDRRALAAAPAQLAALEATGELTRHPIPGPAFTAAGRYLLGRMGDEVALRERRAWTEKAWPVDPRDAEVAALWAAIFDRGFDPEVAGGVRRLFGPDVDRAFQGVAPGLSLPPAAAALRAEQALDALGTLSWDAQVDLAARVVETAGEPVQALGAVLSPAGWADVAACIADRSAWREAWTLLLGTPRPAATQLAPTTLATGGELVVALRLREALADGRARPHPRGLPGWGIVVANRSWIRGQLRGIAGKDPARLRAALLALPGLRSRSSAVLSRWARAWAGREAGTGCGFDPDGL